MTRLALRWRLSPTSPQADSFDLQYAASVDEPAAADWRDGPQAIADFGRPCQRCRSYTLGELTPGTPYWIRVRGTNSSGDGAWSPARKIRTVQGDRPRGRVHRSMPLNPVAGGDIGSPLQWRDGLTFSIVNYRDGSMFEIAPATGQLRTKIGVDYRYTRYWLRARAADGLETDITFNVFVHRGFSAGAGGRGGGGRGGRRGGDLEADLRRRPRRRDRRLPARLRPFQRRGMVGRLHQRHAAQIGVPNRHGHHVPGTGDRIPGVGARALQRRLERALVGALGERPDRRRAAPRAVARDVAGAARERRQRPGEPGHECLFRGVGRRELA